MTVNCSSQQVSIGHVPQQSSTFLARMAPGTGCTLSKAVSFVSMSLVASLVLLLVHKPFFTSIVSIIYTCAHSCSYS